MNKKIIVGLIVFVALGFITYKTSFVRCQASLSFNLEEVLKKGHNVMPVVVIGSGPAGLSSALYSARAGYPTAVIEGQLPGGQLTQTSYVENWPGDKKILGNDLMQGMKDQVAQFNVVFVQDKVEKVDLGQWPYEITLANGNKLYALSIIVATGSTPKTLHVPGEKEYWGKGVTTCATCDAPFYKGRKVVVVGGGDSAAEEALQLSAHASSVEILVRKESMRASKAMQDHIAKIPSISISYNKEIKEISGDGQHVKRIQLYDNKTGELTTKEIDGVFLAIGHDPNTKLFKDQLAMQETGYLVMDGRSQRTSKPGVFAAGDVEDHVYRQAGVAAGSGIKAALDTGFFLQSIGVDTDFVKKIESYLYTNKSIESVEIRHVHAKREFDTLLLKHRVVLADFYGTYCPPCKAMLPVFEQLAGEFKGSIEFIKVNTGEARELVMHYQVVRIPTFVVFKDGKEVARRNGIIEKNEMKAWLQEFIK